MGILDNILRGLSSNDALVEDAANSIDIASELSSHSSQLQKADFRIPGSRGSAPDVEPVGPPEDDPRAIGWDPYSLVEQLGYKERPTAITYATLQTMVWKLPVINAILQTRINQVAAFAVPQRHRFETGFRIKLRDQEAKPTAADKRYIKYLESIISSTGYCSHPRERESFEQFLRKITRDSLTYDQACAEVVYGKNGKPSQWYAVDAATVRLADTYRLSLDPQPDEPKTVQIFDQAVLAEFTDEEMMFGVRNPRTDIRSQGYGTAEMEMLVSTITHLLWGINYNAAAFSQGSMQKGLLNLKGSIPEKQLRAFRRQWYQMVSGQENSWRTPILNAEDVDWVSMNNTNRDMEFSAWMDWLLKVTTGVFLMDPIEINFKFGSQGTRSMFDAANRAKLVESRDKGLKPILRFLAQMMNKYVVWPLDDNFSLEFVGLDSMTPKELQDLTTQRARTTWTLDELRAEDDRPPMPDGMGEIILDANWIAERRAKEQQALQEAQAATQLVMQASMPDGGMPGAAPGGGGAPQPGAASAATGDPVSPEQKEELKRLTKPSHTQKSLVVEVEI